MSTAVDLPRRNAVRGVGGRRRGVVAARRASKGACCTPPFLRADRPGERRTTCITCRRDASRDRYLSVAKQRDCGHDNECDEYLERNQAVNDARANVSVRQEGQAFRNLTERRRDQDG